MNSNSMNSNSTNATSPIVDVLGVLRKEINRLATEDLSSVGQSLSELAKERIEADPYGTLAMAFGIGYGLSSLKVANAKAAAIRVGKLVAMKHLSDLDPSDDGQDSGQNSNQNQAASA